jgi:hypothetical protein
VSVQETEQLLGSVIQLFGSRRVEVGLARFLGMDGEAAFRFAVDVDLETPLPALQRNLQAWEGLAQRSRHLRLNFLLQFLARRTLQGRHGGIARPRNESALGLRFDLVHEPLQQVFEFHGVGL